MSTISVLVPIYYKESPKIVRRCLESLTAQTLPPDELVCALDDPSSEEIERTIDALAKTCVFRIVKCYCKRGSGLGAVLRIGVERCRCDYIARMDADDIAAPERLEKECAYLDSHPETDVVGSNIAEFEDSVDRIIAYRNVPADDSACKRMLKRRDPINHMTAMYRRASVLMAGNYSEEMRSCEDTYLWTAFYERGLGFANIQEHLVFVYAGREMYARRGGERAYRYVKDAIDYKKRVGLIGWGESLFQKAFNYGVLVVMPNAMRAFVYENFLRKKSK